MLNDMGNPTHQEIAQVLSGQPDFRFAVPGDEISNRPPKYEADHERDATEVALLGIYRMWKSQNPTRDKSDFLLVVERAIEQ